MDIIDKLIAEGHAYYDEDGELTGIASDGTHISLHFKYRADAIAYLTDHPTPSDW